MTSNYCSAIWTVIKLGGFDNTASCECPYLPEVCPRAVRCRGEQPQARCRDNSRVTSHSLGVWKCWWKHHIQWASEKVHKPFWSRNLYLYLFLLLWIPAHHLALNASSVGGHQSRGKLLIWSQQDQVDFLLLRGLSHGKNTEMKCLFRE